MLKRPADLESLWQRMTEKDFTQDERLPYWADLWPASILLGRWLTENISKLKGNRCIDLGCGLGLTSAIASSCGAQVIAVDYEWPAVFSAKRSMGLNGVDFFPVQMDWRTPAFKPHSVSYVLGSDILYEERFVEPVAQFLEHVLLPDGAAIISEPARSPSRYSWKKLCEIGFEVILLAKEKIDWNGHPVTIYVRAVRKQK